MFSLSSGDVRRYIFKEYLQFIFLHSLRGRHKDIFSSLCLLHDLQLHTGTHRAYDVQTTWEVRSLCSLKKLVQRTIPSRGVCKEYMSSLKQFQIKKRESGEVFNWVYSTWDNFWSLGNEIRVFQLLGKWEASSAGHCQSQYSEDEAITQGYLVSRAVNTLHSAIP